MKSHRSFWLPALGAQLPFALLVLVLLVYLPTELTAQTGGSPAAGTPSTGANSRGCSANPVLVTSGKSKAEKKSKHPLPPEALPVCLEVKGQAIEIQEFLQSVVREFQWRTGENHASEDTWSFVRYLNDEELAKYGDTKVLVEPVDFSSGKAAVTIRTTELSDGYCRVQITARFQGEGKSTDKALAQPGNIWTLQSKGTLEQELSDALQKRYKHAE